MRSLLDVNVLVAVLDAQHEHHARSRAWLGRQERDGWASCPITENGCIRVLSQPNYPGGGCSPEVAMQLLENLIGLGAHEFWHDDFSLLDRQRVDRSRIQGPAQLTDLYLLSLANKRGGRLATLDRDISIGAIPGARSESLLLIPS